MEFFAAFDAWLTTLLQDYIHENVQEIAQTLAPAIIALGTLYVIVWGYLLLAGHIEEPVMDGLKRILALSAIIALAIHLWLYEEVIVDTFFNAPNELARQIVSADDPTFDSISVVDGIMFTGGDAASALLAKGGILSGDGIAYTLAGWSVYAIVIATAIYAIFLLCLSRVALSILLALGPLFLALLFFRATHRLFAAWLSQLVNYALITVLTILITALMLHLVTQFAQDAADAGAGIQIAHAVRVCMAAGLTLLIMRQVMPMAASIAGGVSLVTFGVVGGAALYGVNAVTRAAKNIGSRFQRRGPAEAISSSSVNTIRFTRGVPRNSTRGGAMKWMCLMILVSLSACSSGLPRVKCDGRLQPINTGASNSTPDAAPAKAGESAQAGERHD